MSAEERSAPEPSRRSNSRSPTARLLGAGARGAERLAVATGADQAIEDAVEEALVRALRSPAVERAVVRILERNAVQAGLRRALASEEVAEAVVDALDTEVADRVWAELLASDKAQMLVERIAEAPEVRAAIAQQGVGLVTDVGRRLTLLTEALDDGAERIVHGVLRRGDHDAETNQVGLFTRALAAAVDLGLLFVLYTISSGLLASVAPVLVPGGAEITLTAVLALVALGFVVGGGLFVTFWALVGQTPGMRFLSIHLEVDGSPEIGLGRALVRLLALPLSLLPAGLGFLAILVSPTRRAWHDHIAGTTVVYDPEVRAAPWSTLGESVARSPVPSRAADRQVDRRGVR
jgi:uncharacterized RDD family membrane protein YckC